ncbi:MAG TPA: hypothetical protein DIU00_11130 [Phycisphaerales bacterium]|nr:hypothetical protein [Phycisphaerales bacterium]
MDGRIFGTMQLALEYGIEPENMAIGAMAGIAVLLQKAPEYNLPEDLRFENWRTLDEIHIEKIINWLSARKSCKHSKQIIKSINNAKTRLVKHTSD